VGASVRHDNWETRLVAYLAQSRDRAFRWGTFDCCIFCAGAIRAITGKDYLSDFQYQDKKGATRYLRDYGGIENIASKFLGEPKKITQAKRGDIVSMTLNDRTALGVCVGSFCAFTVKKGLTYYPLMQCESCWGVD